MKEKKPISPTLTPRAKPRFVTRVFVQLFERGKGTSKLEYVAGKAITLKEVPPQVVVDAIHLLDSWDAS